MRVRYELRYRGQSFELPVHEDIDPSDLTPARGWTPRPCAAPSPTRTSSATATASEHSDVELVTIRVSAWGAAPALDAASGAMRRRQPPTCARSCSTGSSVQATVMARRAPARRRTSPAPPSARCADATLLVPPGWAGEVDQLRHHPPPRPSGGLSDARPDRTAAAHRRPARRLRGDGRRADPLRALLQHQGAPRRLHRAVRRRRADGHAGRAHPRAPRRHARRRGRRARAATPARRVLDPQRPVRRRHAPARHHRHHARVRPPRSAARLRRQPRPPRRRRRPRTRLDARRQPHAGGGGRRDLSPRVLDRARNRGAGGAHAPAARAPRRPARAAGRQPRGRRQAVRAGRAPRPPAAAPGHRRRARLLRAAHPRLPGRAARRRQRMPRRAGGHRRRPAAMPARHRPRRAAAAGLQRQRPTGPRQPQLPAGRHRVGLPVRRARAHRPRHPAHRRRRPPDRGARGARARCSTPTPAPRWRPATWRAPRAWPTWYSARSAAPKGRAR